jgi:hypothetical protein
MVDKAIGVLVMIIGLAALATILSKRANTAKVLDSLLGGLAKLIGQAQAPVTK